MGQCRCSADRTSSSYTGSAGWTAETADRHSSKRSLLFHRALPELGVESRSRRQRVQYYRPDGILIFAAASPRSWRVDGPANDGAGLPSRSPTRRPSSSPGRRPVITARAVGVHVLIRLHFSAHHTGIGGEQHTQRCPAAGSSAPSGRAPFGTVRFSSSGRRVVYLCWRAHLIKDTSTPRMPCSVLRERLPRLWRLLLGFKQPSLYARFSTSCSIPVLRSPICRVTDHWQDVISPILFYLFNVAGACRSLDRDQILSPHLRAALCGIADSVIQPCVCLPRWLPADRCGRALRW